MKPFKKFLLVLLLIGLVAGGIFYFRDTEAPIVNLTPEVGPIAAKTPLKLTLNDEMTGLKELTVTVVQEGRRVTLDSQSFAPDTNNYQVELSLEGKKLKDGPLQIEVATVDQSIYHLGKGNHGLQTFELTYDTRAPIISVLSKAHNFNKGGSGLVLYQLSEEVNRHGVVVGDRFFPGYQQESGVFASLLAFPFDLKDSNFVPRIIAVDLAGNERQAGIYYHTRNKTFRKRKINLSDNFLQQKIPEFETLVPEVVEPIDIFLYVNGEVRKQNREKMVELSRKTSPTPLWDGPFLRQPNASTVSLFADYRDYFYKGKKIDSAVHLGYDLASVARAEIPAANTGEVVFADYLGIYGQCVVIDHGLGLQSLYAHMSQLDVQAGDQVVKGQILGRSGATGMAGGDHLHFGTFIAGLPVQPKEWWDSHWLEDNIKNKLETLQQN
ncbi:MAG TPA: M23 family metallopeptidase [Geopsychrobacteraceae bacterium]|nr:M23 family metallopeptidase [Geopsychrobacteraceae bacterium]